MRNLLLVPATAIALGALPTASLCAENPAPPLASIAYFVATQREVVSVAPAVYATYVGSCLNANAKTPSLERNRSAIYVCIVRPNVVSEMEQLKFLPDTVDRRKITVARRSE